MSAKIGYHVLFVLATLGVATVGMFGAAPAEAGFGLRDLDATFTEANGSAATRAGSHPFAAAIDLGFDTRIDPDLGFEVPDGGVKDLEIEFPPGFVGSPTVVPRCTHAEFLEVKEELSSCPDNTVVGVIALTILFNEPGLLESPVYNLVPPPGVVEELGFVAQRLPMAIEVRVNPDPPYNLIASLTNVSQATALYGSVLTLWGNPASYVHDSERGKCLLGGGSCPAGITERPFLTLPRACAGPLTVNFKADSWQTPGVFDEKSSLTHDGSVPPKPVGIEGCDSLDFSPQVTAKPTTEATQSPSGLDFSLDVEDKGLVDPERAAQSDIKRVAITLPEGMTLNPALAEGLGVCTRADLERETLNSAPGAGCPNASKVGTITMRTPLLDEALVGSLFVAQPDDPATTEPGAENPFDSLIALYMVVRNPTLGIIVKQAARVEPDPATGRLTTVVDSMPQLPFSHFDLHFRDGPRSPLSSPPACGAYDTQYRLAPWSGGVPIGGGEEFTIDRGCGPRGFGPGLSAGAVNTVAGAASTFALNLSRQDGEQNLSGLSAVLPPGLAARFANVPLCPDALAERGDCPPASRVGSATIAAGVGAAPVWIPRAGEARPPIYLAGPYRGAPFSFVVAIRAQAGPIDLGSLVLRAGIDLDPETAQAKIELGPLPQILKGVPIEYRAIHMTIDKPGFIVNPTSCAKMKVSAAFDSAAGARATASDRFQVGGCARLGFKPKLGLHFSDTGRNSHPALTATLRTRPDDANIRLAAFVLPRGELLDQSRIESVCAKARFDRNNCPAASAYGRAKVWSPLLDRPLEGPVYLRASSSKLPDVVADLHGQAHIVLAGSLDTPHGQIRIAFRSLPDIPVSRLQLTVKGGKKGLVVNSEGLCGKGARATAELAGHNGRTRALRPLLRVGFGRSAC